MTQVRMTKCDWCEASIELPEDLVLDEEEHAEMFEGWLHVHTYDDSPAHDFCSTDCLARFYSEV